MFLGENMVAPRRALTRSNSPDDGPTPGTGQTPYTTGDVLALLLELGAIESLKATEQPTTPAVDDDDPRTRGRVVDRYL